VPCLIIFPWEAHKHFRFEYEAYRKSFFIQVAGTFVLMLDNTAINWTAVTQPEHYSKNFFIQPAYLKLLLLQFVCVLVFVLSKQP